MMRASEARRIPTSRLPEGWTQSRLGALATNPDRDVGGIIDIQIGGDWFVIPHREGSPVLEGFQTRDEAFDALDAFLSAT